MSKKRQAPDVSYSKIPPQAIEIEEAVLGAIILEKETLPQVIDSLTEDCFYKEAHVRIFSAIVKMFKESEPIDMLTLCMRLRKSNELEQIGGMEAIMDLTNKVNSAANIESHAKILSEMAIKRQLIRLSSQMQNDAFRDDSDSFMLLEFGQQTMFDIAEQLVKKSFVPISQGITSALSEMDVKRAHDGGVIGVQSGFPSLDRVTGGFQKAELIIMAARPGMGKTAFVVSAIRNASVDFQKPTAIFSLEMSTVQLVNRLMSAEAEIDNDKIRKGSLAPHEWEQLHHRIHRLSNSPIFIDDTPALSVLDLRAKARRLKAQFGIEMIVIDYLQLMSANTGGKGGGNREQEISFISRSLKTLAKELDIPIIALSQLSRAVESRGGDKRPMLSDLRESGAIEQDADVVVFLYRPEYYGITEDEAGNTTAGVGEVIIAKNRSGGLDTVKLRFIGKYTKFTEQDHQSNVQTAIFDRPISIDNPITQFEAAARPIFDYTPAPPEDDREEEFIF
jgi:replicative DNA helicase